MERSKKKGDGSSSSNSNAYHIPSSSKKTIQRLKDSNMDPHQAALLLSQGPFQEVKSKREKRKEMKEARELMTQEKNSDTSSAVKVGEEHSDGVASSESHTSSNDYEKSVDESGIMLAGSAPSSTLVYPVKTAKQQPSPHRGKTYSGRMTMADIVRMSKPPHRHSQTAAEATYACQDSNSQSSFFNHLKPYYDSSHSQMGMQKDQQASDSALPSDGQEALDIGADEGHFKILSCNVIPNYLDLNDVSMREIRNSISPSATNTASLNDKVSSKPVDFQKRILGKEEPGSTVREDTFAVVFPNHEQDIATDLSHLRFGTYTSGVTTAVSESLTSDSLRNNLEKEGLSALTNSSDPRNSLYADKVHHCKKLELDKESRDNAFSHFPESESCRPSIPRAPNAYEYSSSSIQDADYINIIKPDAKNLPLHKEPQSRSLPPTSEVADAMYSVDPVIKSEDFNSTAFSSPVSYSLPLPGVSLAMGSAFPLRMTAFPQSALHHSYNDFLDRDLGTANLSRQFHHDIPTARSAVGHGGVQPQYNADTGLAVHQQAWNSQLSAWYHGSSMRAVPNVLNGRSHRLPAENQLLLDYPQPRLLVQNYEAWGHSNGYNSQVLIIQDQQLGPGGLPFTQAQPSRPPDRFWQQRYHCMSAVPNVLGDRSHNLPAENQLLLGYPRPSRPVRNYEAGGQSNVYNSHAGIIQDQQLGPGGLPFMQAQPSRPPDQFWQQRYRR